MSHVFKPPPSKVDYFQILQIFKNIGNICIRYTKLIKLTEYLLKFHVSSLNRHVIPDFVGEQVYEMDHMFTIHQLVKQGVWQFFHCFQIHYATSSMASVTNSKEVWHNFFTSIRMETKCMLCPDIYYHQEQSTLADTQWFSFL